MIELVDTPRIGNFFNFPVFFISYEQHILQGTGVLPVLSCLNFLYEFQCPPLDLPVTHLLISLK